MRSFGFTLILALLAVMAGGLAAWQWMEGNFYSVLGAPPTPVGQRIYTNFASQDVKFMRISQNGTNASFELGPDGWRATAPWVDRMDPRKAADIIDFTLNLRVEDLADIDKVDPQKAGLRESGINIRLEGGDHKLLAKYKLGRRNPWLATVKDVDGPVPTVFIQPRDENHKNYIYTCTGDIIDRFKDNLKFLRDHHPFYFNPYNLQKVSIKSQQGDMTLLRPVSELITGQNSWQEIRNRFVMADTSRDNVVSRPEWLAMKDYKLGDAEKNRKFDSVDSDKNNLLTPDEFTNAFLGAWRIAKPLDLATDSLAMKTLIEGLFELRATRISDRASVTLPASGTLANSRQIGISTFGSDAETVLEIYPPETPESTEVRATVSNRPDTVFYLPVKPDADQVSLANLPLSIDELRNAALTHLDLKSLRGVLILPAVGPEIQLTWSPPQPWLVTIDGQTRQANQERLTELLQTALEGKAMKFETDAATDFTPWGLDKPILRLRFVGENKQGLELAFGRDKSGNYFVNRTGTTTVMRVDQTLFEAIPRKPYEWRHARLWSIDRNNLMAIEVGSGGGAPLLLGYTFSNPDPWTASREGKDITASLNPAHANYVLDALEGLKVTRWLTPDDASALQALASPSLTIKFIEKATDDMGDFSGLITREVILAPGSRAAKPAFYYGRLADETAPFLMDRETYEKLSTELLEKF